MKYTQLLLVAAVTATTSARVVSEFAEQTVRQTKHRLERIYGRGLVGLRHEQTGKIDHRRFAWSRTLPAVTMTVGDITLDTNSMDAIILGITKGIEYSGLVSEPDPNNPNYDDEEVSNCFYAAHGMVGDLENIANSWNNMVPDGTTGTFNWFEPLVFGPLKAVGNFSVTFEHCQMADYVDTISNMASLDWGAIAERATTVGVDMFMNLPEYQNQAFAALGWYVPPAIPECNPDDFKTASGFVDSKKQQKCLIDQQEAQYHNDQYNKWKLQCYALEAHNVAMALQEQQLMEDAERQAEAAASGFSLEGLFGSLFPSTGEPTGTQTLQAETFDPTAGGLDFEDPELIAACAIYGRTSPDIDYYTLGEFSGEILSKIMGSQLVI